MDAFLKRIENEMTYNQVSRGRGTGPISRILSGISLFILVYFLIHLLKNQQYLPFGILLILSILSFTPFGNLFPIGVIGLFIYFLIINYWVGAILILLCGAITWTSVWFGARNIKRNLYGGRAEVDPFEGMFDLLFIFILQLIFFGLALLTSSILSIIFWVLLGIITLFEIMTRYYPRLKSPWCKLHFPLMMRYSALVGHQMGATKTTDKEFDMKDVLRSLVKSAYPYWEDNEVNLLINAAEQKMANFTDREVLETIFRKNNPPIDLNKLKEVMEKINAALRNPEEKGLYVRYVIGEIVGRDYGEQERLKYIHAVIAGQAF